jgi:hypothetical protein
MKHRIALIHPLQPAMQAAQAAFRAGWPEAHCINLLDDSLPDDLRRAGPLDAGIRRRITTLLHYAAGLQVAGILFTGSGFGPLLDELAPALGVPLLKPNQAMYEEAHALAAARSGRLGMLVTFPEAAAAMRQDFEASKPAANAAAQLEIVCAPEALERLREGNAAEHNRLLAAAAATLRDCDAILMAQFSSAQAAPAVAAATGLGVLTSPDSAVRKLRALVEGR